jgi:K+-transporting ATPase KdpF subunit
MFCARRFKSTPNPLSHLLTDWASHYSEHFHDGPRRAGDRRRLLCTVDRLRVRLRPAVKETAMIFDYSLAAIVVAGLLVYLTYAMLRPEQF